MDRLPWLIRSIYFPHSIDLRLLLEGSNPLSESKGLKTRMGGLSVLKEISHMGKGHFDGNDSHTLLDFPFWTRGSTLCTFWQGGFPASSCLTCRDQN